MEKKNKILIITILIGFLIVLCACLMRNNDRTIIPIRLEDNKELIIDKVPEEYSNINVKMITNYSVLSQNINMTNTTKTTAKEKTVIAFLISGVEDISTLFESLTMYESRREKTCDIEILDKNKDNLYVIASCDGYVDFGTMFVALNIKDPKKEKTLTLEGTVHNESPDIVSNVYLGDIFYVMDCDCWYKLEDDEIKISKQKQDEKGVYYEYEKTLNFFTFGYYTNIDLTKIQIISHIPYEYDINYEVYEIENDKQIEYKKENTTGKKQICITFKIYVDSLNDNINTSIIKKINESYISYDDKKIFFTD